MLSLDRPLTVIDLESTDPDPERARIIQVAARRFVPKEEPPSDQASSGPRIHGHERYTQIVNPGIPVPKEVQDRTGLSQEHITAEGKSWPTVAHALTPLLEDADLAGYNIASHDLQLLEAEYRRLNQKVPGPDDRNIVDAYALEKALNPRTLENVYASYTGDSHDRAHNAAADVDATWKVLEGQCMKHDLQGASPADLAQQTRRNYLDAERRLLKDGNDILLCFGKYEGKSLQWVLDNDPAYLNWMYQTIDGLTTHIDTILQQESTNGTSVPTRKTQKRNSSLP